MVFCNFSIESDPTDLPLVTILILIDGFLQYNRSVDWDIINQVTILILIDGFLQFIGIIKTVQSGNTVTILILIDGFLQ